MRDPFTAVILWEFRSWADRRRNTNLDRRSGSDYAEDRNTRDK